MSKFETPFRALIACRTDEQRSNFIAHALDFDLVCTADTLEVAERRIRSAIKSYIEFGLESGWGEYIEFAAPQEFWEAAFEDGRPMTAMPPILLDHNKCFLIQVQEGIEHPTDEPALAFG